MTHLEALVFGLYTLLNHAFAEGAHGGHRIVEDIVAEVAGTAVEGGHLRHGGGVGRVESLVGGHTHRAAGRWDKDDVRAGLEDGFGALLEAHVALGGRTVVLAHMQVDDGGTGVDGALCFAHYLLDGVGYVGVLLFGDFRAADGGGDDKFVHDIFVYTFIR